MDKKPSKKKQSQGRSKSLWDLLGEPEDGGKFLA